MVTAHMAACPLPFGPLLPHFLSLFVGNALVAADAAALRAMRPKRRVLLVRFIAKALLCPYYRAEWLEVNINLLAAGECRYGACSLASGAMLPCCGPCDMTLLVPHWNALHAPTPFIPGADAGEQPLGSASAVEVERARTAHDALCAMLAPPEVGPLVDALVAKYVALTHEELEEWQVDPEGYIRCVLSGTRGSNRG